MPNRAYLINLPEDKPKLEYSSKLLGELGFTVEIIEGVKSVQVPPSYLEMQSLQLKDSCQTSNVKRMTCGCNGKAEICGAGLKECLTAVM